MAEDAEALPPTTENATQAISAGEEVLRHFWDLASLEEPVRTNAAASLAEDLVKSQLAHESNGIAHAAGKVAEGSSKQAKVDAALHVCSPLVVYSVRRLVRGLASGRQAARQGFALALTLLLVRVPAVATEAVVGLMDIWLQSTNSMKGSDARDAAMGRMFCYSALVRSGRAGRDPALARRIASALVGAKYYLREVSTATLLELLEQQGDSELAGLLAGADGVAGFLQIPVSQATPEVLFLALRLWGRLPADVKAGCSVLPQGVQPPAADFFTASKPAAASHPEEAAAAFFSAEHLAKVLEPLRSSTASHPRLHSVWTTVLALLIPGFTPYKVEPADAGDKGAPGAGQLETFWRVVVEGDLFASSHERKYLGFQLFTLLLPFLGPDQVPAVFTPRFYRCLVNSLAGQDRHLHAAAKKAIDRLTSFAERASDPSLRVALAVALQRHGALHFDRLTKTKTAAHLLQSMDGRSIQLYISHLKGVFAAGEALPPKAQDGPEEGSDSDAEEGQEGQEGLSSLEAARRWVVEQLAGACGLSGVMPETQRAAALYLTTHAFFKLDASQVKGKQLKAAAKVQPPPSEAIRHFCAARLISVVEAAGKAHRGRPPGNARAEPAQAGTPAATEQALQHERRGENSLLRVVVEHVSSLQEAQDRSMRLQGAALAVELSEPIEAAVKSLRSLESRAAKGLAKLGSDEDKAKGGKRDQLLSLLQLSRWLQLYVIGDAENMEPELADELLSVYKAAFGKAGKRDSDGAGPFMDRLVDILLSLLAYSSAQLPSAPLREAVEAVFRAFAAHLTTTGMQDLIRIISQPEKAPKDQERSVLAADSDDDDEEDDTDEEEDAEEAVGSPEQSDEEAEPEAEAERPAAMEIDNGQPTTSDQGADDDMTDEQMFKMDKLLAAVLRTQKDAKNAAKTTKQAVQNFKLRTLALLDAFAKAVPGSGLIPGVLLDLIKAAEAAARPSGNVTIAERLRGVISKLCRTKPDQEAAAGVDPDRLCDAIIRIHLLAAKPSCSNNLKAASDAAQHYLLSVAHAAGTDAHAATAAAGGKRIVSDYFMRRDLRIRLPLLQDIFRRHPGIAEAVLPDLAAFVGSARTVFLQAQALTLLATILRLPQDRQVLIADALRPLMPVLAKSSAAVVEGINLGNASKHADMLKSLALVWELTEKLEPELAATASSEVEALREACRAAFETAATAKVFNALVRMATILGLSTGQFDPDSTTKRDYQKSAAKGDLGATAAKTSNKAKQNKLMTTQAGPATAREEQKTKTPAVQAGPATAAAGGPSGGMQEQPIAAKRKGKKTSDRGSGVAEKKQKKGQGYDKAEN